MEPTRRDVLAAGSAVLGGLAGCTSRGLEESDDDATNGWAWDGTIPVDRVTQHHLPSCDCCGKYADYLERNGFDVLIEPASDPDALAETKAELSIPESMRSCHTVEFGGYVVEGHVPLSAIETLFETNASIYGVSVPGMPQHAPGMGPPGEEPLTVYAFRAAGGTTEFLEVG